MKFLDSKYIDRNKWDDLVSNCSDYNIFSYSWYLDATCKRWGAILNENYTFGIPLPYKKVFFYSKIFQHPFSRNIAVLGDKKYIDEAIKLLYKFNNFSFSLSTKIDSKISLPFRIKKYQYIDLSSNFKFKKNAERIISKNIDFYHFKTSNNIENVLNFYFNNSFQKIKQQNINKFFLKKLLINALKNGKGDVIEVFNSNNQLRGASFFLKEKNWVIYLIGDCDFANKKNGLMFSTMSFAIEYYKKNNFSYFDFGGSNIESVATFYKKLGGIDVEYFEYYKK